MVETKSVMEGDGQSEVGEPSERPGSRKVSLQINKYRNRVLSFIGNE